MTEPEYMNTDLMQEGDLGEEEVEENESGYKEILNKQNPLCPLCQSKKWLLCYLEPFIDKLVISLKCEVCGEIIELAQKYNPIINNSAPPLRQTQTTKQVSYLG